MGQLAPVLTPHGRLLLAEADDAPALPADLAHRLRSRSSAARVTACCSSARDEVGTALPPVLGYWRELGARYVTAVCTLPDVEERPRARRLFRRCPRGARGVRRGPRRR